MTTESKTTINPTKHHAAGHAVSFNANGGTYHCITCGHPVLTYMQEMAPELLKNLIEAISYIEASEAYRGTTQTDKSWKEEIEHIIKNVSSCEISHHLGGKTNKVNLANIRLTITSARGMNI